MRPALSPSLEPVAVEERLANLDVLRALALFGVLIVNLLAEFRVSIFEQFFGPASGSLGSRDRSLRNGRDREQGVHSVFVFVRCGACLWPES
jgi:uncharacterized membrane protein YeiB